MPPNLVVAALLDLMALLLALVLLTTPRASAFEWACAFLVAVSALIAAWLATPLFW